MTSLLTLPALTVLVPLLDEKPAAEDVAPGWAYPLMFFSLVAVTILLWLSMRKQLKKIRFHEEPADERPDAGPVVGRPDDERPDDERPGGSHPAP